MTALPTFQFLIGSDNLPVCGLIRPDTDRWSPSDIEKLERIGGRVVEYVPRVRCDGCKHARSVDGLRVVPYAGYPIALCGGIGICAGQWHPREWFCADHEPKETT